MRGIEIAGGRGEGVRKRRRGGKEEGEDRGEGTSKDGREGWDEGRGECQLMIKAIIRC